MTADLSPGKSEKIHSNKNHQQPMSTTNWTEEEAQNALGSIVKRATTDHEFRRLALENPAAAVLEATGKPLPEGFEINVLENDGADLTVVLPDAIGDSELSDGQLEAIAGGKDTDPGRDPNSPNWSHSCRPKTKNPNWFP
jgi:hypothetical protein